MAFRSRDLSVLAYANGFTLWHYRTGDGLDEVVGSAPSRGYFAGADELLRAGDQIIVNLLGEGQPAIRNLMVSAVAPKGVNVRAM